MKRRALTPEEIAMWETITRTDMPLPNAHRLAAADKPPARITVTRDYEQWSPAVPAAHEHMHVALGAYAGIDRNTADTFRKGEYPIDATLDLHGMTREKAHRALSVFLRAQYDRSARCLLVITGKGQKYSGAEARDGGMAEIMGADVRGVLKDALPGWLCEPGLKGMVLTFDTAKPKHGGSGAYYILLRRRR